MKALMINNGFYRTVNMCGLIVVATFLLACQSSSADESQDSADAPVFPAKGFAKLTEYPVEGVNLGQGWHDNQGEKAQAVCIEFEARSDDGQEKTMNMEVVTDRSEMMQSMNLSAEVQVKAIAYEVSGKASYAKEVDMKSENMNFVAHARVNNGVQFTAPLSGAKNSSVALTPAARNLASGNHTEFERQCGEAFVSAIYSGGELNAVLSFAEQSSSERESIETSMKGSGWGFEAEGSASQKMESYSSSSKLRISYHQTGGKGDPIPTDQQGFVEAIHRLPQLAADAGYNYQIMVRSYKSLPNYPGKSSEPQTVFREELAVSYGRLLSIHDEITQILQDSDNDTDNWVYGPEVTDSTLRELQDELKTKLRAQRELARRCAFSEAGETSNEQPCTLPGNLKAMNDYQYQIVLPVPKGAANGDITTDIINYRVKRISEFRCEDDLDDPGCLTNRQIDRLKEQLDAKV